jgi:hypothetical protein
MLGVLSPFMSAVFKQRFNEIVQLIVSSLRDTQSVGVSPPSITFAAFIATTTTTFSIILEISIERLFSSLLFEWGFFD